ncbi:MAG: relaxase domain-containing protein [Solirubrobacterales bacterium]|nr:relaxase domain-containing protein [Solirubrobacterales bacterium]
MREHVPVVRRRYSGQVVEEPAKDLIAAEYQHTTARGVAGGRAPDPQLHSHVVISGVVREDDRLVAVMAPGSRRSASKRTRADTWGATAYATHSLVAIQGQPLMARPSSGQITESRWRDGKTVTFGARLYAYGRRHRLVFGTNTQGWNQTRAQIELEAVLQQVARGTWLPPERRTSVVPRGEAQPDGHQRFDAFARKVVDAKKSHGLDEDTITDLEWRLGYLLGHFASFELVEIDVAAVDAFRDDLAGRSRVIRDVAARGKPLLETGQTGRWERVCAPQACALEHFDQLHPRAAKPDPPAGRGLSLHRAQPAQGRRTQGAVSSGSEARQDVS